MKLCNATITDVTSSFYYANSGHMIYFNLHLLNKYEETAWGYSIDLLNSDSINKLISKHLLVAVDSTNPEKYHQLLLTKEDFQTYGITIPDSLQYLKNCWK